jgi:hypothetical protein
LKVGFTGRAAIEYRARIFRRLARKGRFGRDPRAPEAPTHRVTPAG